MVIILNRHIYVCVYVYVYVCMWCNVLYLLESTFGIVLYLQFWLDFFLKFIVLHCEKTFIRYKELKVTKGYSALEYEFSIIYNE